MSKIALIIMLAITVEALIEYAKTIGKALFGGSWKTAVTQLAAIAVSVLLCFTVDADFYAALGVSFTYGWIGIVLTGIFASRGSNYVSDFISKLRGVKAANLSDLLPADVLAEQTTPEAEAVTDTTASDQAAAVPVPDSTVQ